MPSSRHSVVRWLLAVLILGAAASWVYSYRRGVSAERVRAEMLAIIEDMQLPEAWHQDVVGLIETAHERAFNQALDVSQRLGRKFDADVYYQEVMDPVIGWLREDGKEDVADRLARERSRFSLHTTER